MRLPVMISTVLLAAWSLSARAQEPSEPAASPVEVHGFVSQGFIKTSENNYLAESERGSFEFNEVGINFTKQLTDDLRAGLQLFARDLGPIGNYSPQFDWFYLDYRFANWLGFRAGRTKIPFGLYNEVQDTDAARVPVLLPQSIYTIDNRDFLLAQTGGELYGYVPIGDAGSLEYRAYGGTLFADPPEEPQEGVTITDFDVPYVYGGRLMWQTPIDGLQVGGTVQALRFDTDYRVSADLTAVFIALGLVPPDFMGALPTKFRVKLYLGSIEYSLDDLLLSAEYGRWVGEFESNAPAIFPEHVVNERYYAMASYRVTEWFTPGIYYSAYYPNVDEREGRANYQHDVALTFRYDLTPNWLLKVESHYMNGTAVLEQSLNGGKEPDVLPKEWGVFLLKTTAYF